MNEAKKRYLAVIQLRSDTPANELAKRVKGLQGFISSFSDGEMQLAFLSPEGHVLGVLFKSNLVIAIIRAELDKATTNGDAFLIIEAGDLAAEKNFGRPATWLQHH